MRIDLETLEVKNNAELSRFEAQVSDFTAVIDYQLVGNKIIFLHTGVPDEIAGHGIGGKMAKTALGFARDSGLKVVPQCPFVAGYISRHPVYLDLVVNSGWEA
jgi:predicted GNAT family acetyltransferase